MKIREKWISCLGIILILVTTVVVTVSIKAKAQGVYDNALIADTALQYVGQSGTRACSDANKTGGDQCKQFVNCIVWLASSGTQWPGPGYNSGFESAGGLEVTSSDAVKGDIIQLGNSDTEPSGSLHTAIVMQNKGSGLFEVVDANWQFTDIVKRHDWSPPSAARFWRMAQVNSVGWNRDSSGLYTGSPPDGTIVENVEGNHLYVAAGGSLFWFDRSSSFLWETFVAQRRRLLGEIPVSRMSAADVHALEANYPTPRHHVPRDNTYLYEVGTVLQYVMMYGYSFPVNEGDLDYLGGRNRALVIPSGNLQYFTGVPNIPNDVLLKDHVRPEVYHVVWNTLYHANNETVRDCVKKVKGGSLQPVPASLLAKLFQAGRYSGSIASCSFPTNWAVHGPGGAEYWQITGSNPYVRSRYIDALALLCRLGVVPTMVEISTAGINGPVEAAPITCQDNTFVRIVGNGETFQVRNHMLHYIPWPEMLNCLTHGNPNAVINLDGSVVATTPRGDWAYCDFEGKQIRSPDGRVWWIKQGVRRQVPNTAVTNCLKARAGTGDTVDVTWDTVAAYTLGNWAYCPYGLGVNFVKETSSSTIWKVNPNGSRQAANGFCVADPFTTNLYKYRVWTVPDGEVQGHSWDGSAFSVSVQNCQALPEP